MSTCNLHQNRAIPTRYETHLAFARFYRQGRMHQFWARVRGRHHALLNLHAVHGKHLMQSRHHAGICTVPIEQIRGSEGRCHDFDVNFRPLQNHSIDRWVSVANARQTDVPLPLVELIQIDDTYFVRDGHHRISVARWSGQRDIEAEVTVWHSRGEDAKEAGQAPILLVTNPRQRPLKMLATRVAKASERLLMVVQLLVVQKANSLAERTLAQEG